MKAIINVYLKEGVLDPQGKAAHHALGSLGFDNVTGVRIGKQIVVTLDTTDRAQAEKELDEMTQILLANTVIEDYSIEIVG